MLRQRFQRRIGRLYRGADASYAWQPRQIGLHLQQQRQPGTAQDVAVGSLEGEQHATKDLIQARCMRHVTEDAQRLVGGDNTAAIEPQTHGNALAEAHTL